MIALASGPNLGLAALEQTQAWLLVAGTGDEDLGREGRWPPGREVMAPTAQHDYGRGDTG
jgi:hypothetical protein